MNWILLISLVGSIFSIISVFISERFRNRKVLTGVLIFVFFVLGSIITNLNSKLVRVQKISASALELTGKRDFEYTNEGYVQACLSFLEQNKDVFPDSYNRAIRSYEKYKNQNNQYSTEIVSLAYEMDGLIKGISILTKEK